MTKSYYAFIQSLPKESPRFFYCGDGRQIFDRAKKMPQIASSSQNYHGEKSAREKIFFRIPPDTANSPSNGKFYHPTAWAHFASSAVNFLTLNYFYAAPSSIFRRWASKRQQKNSLLDGWKAQ